MTVIKLALLISLLITQFVHGAPSQIVSSKTDNCSWWKYVRDELKCAPETTSFSFQNFKALFMREKDNDRQNRALLSEVYKGCGSVQKCFAETECHSDSFEVANIFCDFLAYVHSPRYQKCESLLDITPHNCEQKYLCGFFGVDKCQKELFIRVCGQDEWNQYKDIMLKLLRVNKAFAEKCYSKYFEDL